VSDPGCVAQRHADLKTLFLRRCPLGRPRRRSRRIHSFHFLYAPVPEERHCGCFIFLDISCSDPRDCRLASRPSRPGGETRCAPNISLASSLKQLIFQVFNAGADAGPNGRGTPVQALNPGETFGYAPHNKYPDPAYPS
jgi:hypothetical protein